MQISERPLANIFDMRYVKRMTSGFPRFRMPMPTGLRRLVQALGLVFLPVMASPALQAAELVMFERPGCMWCMRWHKEVGPIYPKTPEGERAPLRARMIDRNSQAEYRLREPVFYTPTFVLVEKGQELGRITGYMGDDAFWGLMKMLAAKLDAADQTGK